MWDPIDSDSDCEMEDAESKIRCGYIRRLIFKASQDTDVAVDVALIMFDKDTIACNEMLHFSARDRDVEKLQLKAVDQNFKRRNLKFTSGKIFKQEEKKVDLGYKTIKCGIMTGLSVGTLAFNSTHCQAQVKVTDHLCSVPVHGNSLILKGQLVVNKTAGQEFFMQGDSGSAVFVKNDNSFECLGLAIGGIVSSQQTLVTPIEDVLRELKEQNEGASRPN
ncbi:uncharacterized protein LOC117318739 [Pecten maximus]|uniref:uncharacterized protein LOC117318739 n=1 Tax=Pecten maximus TaxID=6579 RepID=UPI001458CA57|nr:uncharacterized protein LOC117318739 [Pecten maximus]